MLSSNLNNTPSVGTRSSKTLISSESPNSTIKVELGQKLQGAVQAQVSAGLFKVAVAGQVIQMRLPDYIRSGDVLELQVVSLKPQLTFNLAASNNPISTREQIGAAAKLLSDLAALPLKDPRTRQASGTAVWQTPDSASDNKQLAGALRDALANSGLFYESHQAQWVRGERSTAQLLVEPQNQLASNQTAGFDASLSQPTTASDAQSGNTLPIAKELLPLVQQQLHTLETHQLIWSGQVWAGQQMQWEIQGQPHQQTAPIDERQWSTEMELALPHLGDVHAKLVFNPSGLKITLHAADANTLQLFNRKLSQLQSALANADITLSSATVEKS